MKIKVLLTFAFFCFLSTTTINAQDSDGDGVDDITDLDDDNDGIVDSLECEVPIAEGSFETTAPYGIDSNWSRNFPFSEGQAGNHDLNATNYIFTPDGVQFLYINSDGPTGINGVTLNVPLSTYEPTNYQFSIWVGDGILDTNNYRNDGNSTIELGFGDNAGAFNPIPGAVLNIVGATDTPNGWTEFLLDFTINIGDPAVGNGVLIRITHERVDGTTLAGNYDFIQLKKDTDGDGLSDCIDVDSDGDGCPDVEEAGFTNSGSDTLAGGGIDPITGEVTGNTDGYTLTSGFVTDFINHCGDNNDYDNDEVNNYTDLDDDNDGILDSYECDIPITNSNFEDSPTVTGWTGTGSGLGSAGIITTLDNVTDYPNFPEGNQFLYINDTESLTLNNPGAAFEPADYILNILIGDGLAFNNQYRNDGQTVIELGYDDGIGFQPLANGVFTIEPYETPNGSWTNFRFTATVNAGDPALGYGILVRITHNGNPSVLQSQGNYDQIRISKDTDRDGITDCFSPDTDGDGCNDVIEAGHIDSDGNGFLGNGVPTLTNGNVDGNGLVLGAGGYTGQTSEVLDSNLNPCNPGYLDNDNDGVSNNIDLDDDNDGIRDSYECEVPLTNSGFENFDTSRGYLDGWYEINLGGSSGQETVIDGTNYIAAPEGATYAFINGNSQMVSSDVYGTFEEGSYLFEILVGDGIDYSNGFRNDGQSLIELGYHDGDYNNFIPINSITIEGFETPNGVWTNFALPITTINAGDAALGQAIAVRITHTANAAALQSQGNYDNIRIVKDTDGDGISNCFDLDSDDPTNSLTCPDAVEAGHVATATGELVGGPVDGNGMVTGFATGYYGTTSAVSDATIDTCNPLDTDNDTYSDGDIFTGDISGAYIYDDSDNDNDNDGITDEDEGCNLTAGIAQENYNFELPRNNFVYYPPSGLNQPFNAGLIDFWTLSNTTAIGVALVNSSSYINPSNGLPYSGNYITDGTRIPDNPTDPIDPGIHHNNDQFAYINGDGIITQNPDPTRNPIIQEGSYIMTIAIGDGLDTEDLYRNDGRSIIELGYINGGGFVSLASRTVEPYETPNGTWTDFTLQATATPASIGEILVVRITHEANNALNQGAGNYDYIRISFDYDGDGIPDCQDDDSDNDGCPDTIEAGFSDDDRDGILGVGSPTVNNSGIVQGLGGYSTPVSPNVRSFSEPAVINNPLVDQTACEGDNAAFFLDASRAGTNPTIVYEWTISTDGGTSFNPLPETSNTLTLTGVVATDDGNIYRVRVMGDDNLCYEESQATLTITPGPTVPTLTPVNAAICEGANAEFTITGDAGAIVEYTINGGALQTATLDGSGLFTVTENAVTVDTTIELTSITNGSCTLALAPTLTETITVSAIPTITNAPTTCSADLSSYDVDITVSAGTIANPSAGTLVGNVVNGIPAGTNITIEVNNNGCTVVLPITAPNCSCPTVNQPINPVNAGVCEGNPNNPISVELDPMGAGDTINWYDAPTGGTLLGTGLSFTSTEILPGIYTYYAEAEEAVSGCVSSTRVQVVYSINSNVIADVIASPIEECDAYILPPLSAGNNYYTGPGATGLLLNAGDAITTSQTIYIYAESGTTPNCTDESSFDVTIYQSPTLQFQSLICSADLATYTITLQPYTGTISSVTAGTIVDNLTVTNIPAGTGIEIFIENGTCTPSIFVQAPNCTCPVLDAPVNPQNGSNCEGEPTASIAVDIPTTGDSIDWYDAPTGGNLLVNGASSFTPTETLPGTYTYYAETVESISGCTSDTRTAVTLTIATQPTADNFADQLVCDSYVLPNLSANNTFRTETNGNGIQLNPGDVITTSQTIYVYAANASNANCFDESSFEVTITPGPEAPINPTNGFNCEGQPTAALSVEFPPSNGDTINWYDAQIGGNLIATGTAFIPTDNLAGVYTYYAENSDSTNPSCVSSRTAVTLTITATPTVDSSNDIEACEVYVLPNLSANNRYFTGPNGTGTQLFAGEEIITDQTIYIRAESAQNPDCSSESSFTIVILNEPVLLFPEILPLCADDLGTVDAIELGMDLGPGYRYDWTPNNDQNGDGVEEAVFVVTQPGTYSLRVYQTGTNGECGGSVAYTTEVVETLRPLNVEVDVTAEGYELNANNRVRVIVNDDNLLIDQFEYSLDNPDGPFQQQNYFENVVGGLHRVYVRGLQDCGGTISSDVFLIVNHPTFFTPNGDGINDTWNILGTENPNITDNVVIQIFDRHGKLMDQISPFGEGWDGTYNGSPMPASDYWFTVSYTDLLSGENVSFNGHFSLKR